MEPEELRRGNLIHNVDKSVCEIDYVHPVWQKYLNKSIWHVTFINTKGDEHPVDIKRIDACTPIPLTEEWLEKFGFGYNDEDERKAKRIGKSWNPSFGWHTLFLMEHDNGYWFIVESTGRKAQNLGTIKYVHQAQNLFFALTGEELKRKT